MSNFLTDPEFTRFPFKPLPFYMQHLAIPGTYDYRISKTGYMTTNGQVTVSSSNQIIDITLTV